MILSVMKIFITAFEILNRKAKSKNGG